MQDTGFKTAASVISTGAWTGFTAARLNSSNNVKATYPFIGSPDFGELGTFTFNLPAGATINGIEATAEFRSTSAFINATLFLSLSYNGGTNYTSEKSSTDSSGVDTTVSFGGAADTWGRTWSTSEFADGTFQLKLRGSTGGSNLEVDYVAIKVYYTPSGNSTKANIKATTTQGMSSKADIKVTTTRALSSKGNIKNAYADGQLTKQGEFYPTDTQQDATGSYSFGNITGIQQQGGLIVSGALTGTSIVRFNYLDNTQFGFSIPSTATIKGIEVKLNRHASQNTATRYIVDHTIQLIVGGTAQGNNKADTTTHWLTTEYTTITYGSSTDTWGLSLSPSDINGLNFGVRFTAQGREADFSNTTSADIDWMNVLVHYTDLSTGVSAIANITYTFPKPNSAKANIVAPGQQAEYAAGNVLVTGNTKATSSKASIVVTNTDSNSGRASVVVTNSKDVSIKANILTTYTQAFTSKADILVVNNVIDNSVKAQLFRGYNNWVKACITSVNDNSIKANIITTYYSGAAYDWKLSTDDTSQNRGYIT